VNNLIFGQCRGAAPEPLSILYFAIAGTTAGEARLKTFYL